MTSNQILKGVIRHNDLEINKLRATFFKQPSQNTKIKKIGAYKVIKEIGKGGFAQVYEVEDELGRRLALK